MPPRTRCPHFRHANKWTLCVYHDRNASHRTFPHNFKPKSVQSCRVGWCVFDVMVAMCHKTFPLPLPSSPFPFPLSPNHYSFSWVRGIPSCRVGWCVFRRNGSYVLKTYGYVSFERYHHLVTSTKTYRPSMGTKRRKFHYSRLNTFPSA